MYKRIPMRGLYKLVFIILVFSSFTLAQDSPFFARLERVCLSVSINTDQPKDQEVEKEVLAIAIAFLQEASFEFIEGKTDPRCSELTTGLMSFSAYGPNSYPGNVGPFETGLSVSMPTSYEDIPRIGVYSKYADAIAQAGDDTTLYQTLKEQVPMWLAWFLDDLQKAKVNAEKINAEKVNAEAAPEK
jgi:hypothetical protein